MLDANQVKCPLTVLFLMCFSITDFSDLFTNESNDTMFVYRPSNSKANRFKIMNCEFDHYADGLHHLKGHEGN